MLHLQKQNQNVSADMSDDDLFIRLKQTKNKRDKLEERVKYLEMRTGFLTYSLINALHTTEEISAGIQNDRYLPKSADVGLNIHGNKPQKPGPVLKDFFVTVLRWVEMINSLQNSDPNETNDLIHSLRKAILWAVEATPEDEDYTMQSLLQDCLMHALKWVRTYVTKEEETELELQLRESLIYAINWTSHSDWDDVIMRQILENYVISVLSWTKSVMKEEQPGKSPEETRQNNIFVTADGDREVSIRSSEIYINEASFYREMKDQIERNVSDKLIEKEEKRLSELSSLAESIINSICDEIENNYNKETLKYEDEHPNAPLITKLSNPSIEEKSRKELQEIETSLTEFSGIVKTIDVKQEAKIMQNELLEILTIAIHLAKNITSEDEDVILKQILAQTLLLAVDWLMRPDVVVDNDVKQELLESLEFVVEWATSTEEMGEDAIIRQLLRHVLATSGNQRSNKTKTRPNTALEENEKEELYQVKLAFIELTDGIRNLKTNEAGRAMKMDLLETLNTSILLAENITHKEDDEILKRLMARTLLISVEWIMSDDVDEDENVKNQLLDSIMFVVNWAIKGEAMGEDAVLRQLLRDVLETTANRRSNSKVYKR